MIPSAHTLIQKEGYFIWDTTTFLTIQSDTSAVHFAAEQLIKHIHHVSGFNLTHNTTTKLHEKHILLKNPSTPPSDSESYTLSISENRIVVEGNDQSILYAIATLCQLLRRKDGVFSWPCLEIQDHPTFTWRGLMLDSSRHFLPKNVILRYLDIMVHLKMNRFHFHLVDDHGWRMEVKAYPELTRLGAFLQQEEGRRGFYTRQDIEEIVQYATQRNIMVIPEIEIPGHSYAALYSLPELCCTRNPQWQEKGLQKDLYCAGKEFSFTFLQNVLNEVLEIFPAPYIHIGGDEAPKERWQQCPDCQARIAQEGLQNEEELQAYMIRRLAIFIQSKGRQVIGWEEIMDGNADRECVVQWWRHRTHGYSAVFKAAQRGHQQILSPNSFTYLSFPVFPNENFRPERTSDLRKVYTADWIPVGFSSVDRKNILGAECCVWTEHLDAEGLDRMVFPRILACAERIPGTV
jgi:hexosaminidase